MAEKTDRASLSFLQPGSACPGAALSQSPAVVVVLAVQVLCGHHSGT